MPQGLGGLVHACPSASRFGNKGWHRGGVGQDSTMPSIAKLAEAVAVVNTSLAVKEQEEQ